MKHHAECMAKLFPPNKVLNECECCQRHSAEMRATFEWRGVYLTAGTAITSIIGTVMTIALMHHVFHFLLPSKHIDFSTTHSFCNGCFTQIKKRKLAGKLVKQLCLTLIVLAAMILASAVVFAVLFLFPQPTKEMTAYATIGLFCGLICLVAGLVAEDRIVRWCLPGTMRPISKPPFELIGFHSLAPTTG